MIFDCNDKAKVFWDIPVYTENTEVRANRIVDFFKVARSLLVEWTWHELSLARATRSLARALTIALRASKQGARSRFALLELDL